MKLCFIHELGFLFFPKTFKIVDYEDELDLLSTVAVTQIGADGRAHLDLHCNEQGILLKSIPLLESWDVVRRIPFLLVCVFFLFILTFRIPAYILFCINFLFRFEVNISIVLPNVMDEICTK